MYFNGFPFIAHTAGFVLKLCDLKKKLTRSLHVPLELDESTIKTSSLGGIYIRVLFLLLRMWARL